MQASTGFARSTEQIPKNLSGLYETYFYAIVSLEMTTFPGLCQEDNNTRSRPALSIRAICCFADNPFFNLERSTFDLIPN